MPGKHVPEGSSLPIQFGHMQGSLNSSDRILKDPAKYGQNISEEIF